MERARSADPRAFRALYDLGFRLVFAWSLRALGSRGHAESLTAAALRRGFAALSDYDGSVSLGGWLIRHAESTLRVGVGSAPARSARSAEDRS